MLERRRTISRQAAVHAGGKTTSDGRILGLPGKATGALTMDNHIGAFDGANTAQTGRQTDGVKIWP